MPPSSVTSQDDNTTPSISSTSSTATTSFDSLLFFVKQLLSFVSSSSAVSNPKQYTSATSPARIFIPTKDLHENDHVIIDMLNSHNLGTINGSTVDGNRKQQTEEVAFCICDPSLPDLPIIFASDEFCRLTGYSYQEIEGKNCRFLQGKDTKKEDVDKIRNAIKKGLSTCVNLLNYKKDGTEFVNEFFISPLKDRNATVAEGGAETAYIIGVQCAVAKLGPGQMPSNPGWVYSLGNHM